jgi:hypothetical protein
LTVRRHRLSKSKILAGAQCQKRLWLEVHQPELREEDAAAEQKFAVGHQVGDVARSLYPPLLSGISRVSSCRPYLFQPFGARIVLVVSGE